ncbi:MAG TPA: hypothetical protein VFU94_07030 [Conexibacter sp.]|nr:hypothetical protein [Conexibacter sp.]
MLHVLAAAAPIAREGSKTAFYLAGGALACWAVLIGVIGITSPTFPRSNADARAVMLVSGVLMAAAMATAVIVSS